MFIYLYSGFYKLFLIIIGLNRAPLKKGGWGDLECLEHYIFREFCVSPKLVKHN
jgi:hypothetical protein